MTIPILLPLMSAIFVFFLGVFVFSKNYKSQINLTFLLFCVAITIWMFGTFMMFLNRDNKEIAIFWDRFVYIGVVFIPAIMFNFVLAIINNKKRFSRIVMVIGYVFSLFFFFLVFNKNFVDDVFVYQWGIHTKAQFWHHVFLFYFFIYLTLFFVWLGRYYFKIHALFGKLQIKYIFTAFLMLAIFGSMGYLPAYGISIYPFSYLSGVVFVVILAYAITRYHLMDVKVITTEIFSSLLIITSLIAIFQPGSYWELIGRIIIFIITLVFATLLIKAVHLEVHRREEMEVLTKKLRKATKKLAAANKELQRLDQAKSEFLSIASHQLRTPLTVIKGYISMMLEGSFGKIPKIIKDNLEKVYLSSERLIGLVESLLNISRIEAGRLEFNIQPVDLAKVVESIMGDFQQKAKKKKLKLEFHSEPNLLQAATDPQKIKEVISNLLDNAIKYTDKGEVVVSLHQESQSVVFSCQDTGMGILPDDLPRLFEKFVRGKGMMQIHTEGTGLGLYFARMVIENMGGRIWAESAGKGKGSKFSFSLPLADKSLATKIKQ